MALQKIRQDRHGNTVEYHHIARCEYRKGGGFYLEVWSYKSEDARQAGKEPADIRQYRVGESEINPDEPLFSQLYNLLKQQPELLNAADI